MLVSFEDGFGQSLSYDLLLREVVKAMACRLPKQPCQTLSYSFFSLLYIFI